MTNRKVKLNVIDIIIIVAVIALAGVFFTKFTGSNSGTIGAATKDKVELVFLNAEIPADYVNGKIKEGDLVSDRNTNAVFGKVTKIATKESNSYAYDAEGKITMGAKPEYVFLEVTVLGNGVLLDKGGVMIDNTDYYINRNLDVRIGNTVMPIRLSNFKKAE